MTEVTDRERLTLLVHEVRSPVAALAAVAAASDDGLDDEALLDLVRLALAACRGIARNVFDAQLASLRVERVDIRRFVADAVAAAALAGGHIRADIETDPAGGDVPTLAVDPLRLRQALDNLISNALAHSTPGREVVVSVRIEDARVLVGVANEGDGIPAADQARIFESGVRLAADRQGSGIGLSVACTIVDAHRGSLTLVSTPGAGAMFTIALPLD
jgi:signal transduction histidine kinase